MTISVEIYDRVLDDDEEPTERGFPLPGTWTLPSAIAAAASHVWCASVTKRVESAVIYNGDRPVAGFVTRPEGVVRIIATDEVVPTLNEHYPDWKDEP